MKHKTRPKLEKITTFVFVSSVQQFFFFLSFFPVFKCYQQFAPYCKNLQNLPSWILTTITCLLSPEYSWLLFMLWSLFFFPIHQGKDYAIIHFSCPLWSSRPFDDNDLSSFQWRPSLKLRSPWILISAAPVRQLPNANSIPDINSRAFTCFICLEVTGLDHNWTINWFFNFFGVNFPNTFKPVKIELLLIKTSKIPKCQMPLN